MKDFRDTDIQIGDFILYVTKTESPGFQFGWVEDITNKPNSWGRVEEKLVVRRADKHGERHKETKFIYNEVTQTGHREDTGKLEKLVRLDPGPNRFMVMQPI